MTVTRRAGIIVASLCATAILTGCGGSDGDPVVKPTSETPSAAATDANGFTAEQREVIATTEAYSTAIVGRGASPIGPAVQDLVTKDVYDFIVPAETDNIDNVGLQYIGQTKFTPKTVSVSGDTATIQGCSDGSAAFIVKKGETSAGIGARPVTSADIDFTLVRQGDRWLISDTKSTAVDQC